jgi:hypothetical protein
MRHKTSKLLSKVASHMNWDLKKLKRSWNELPWNQRATHRQALQELLLGPAQTTPRMRNIPLRTLYEPRTKTG